MISVELLVLVSLGAAGFAFSALYSGLEMGTYAGSPLQLRLRAAHGDHRALRLQAELSNSSRLLAVLLLANNAANYLGSFALAEILTLGGLGTWQLIGVQMLLFTPLLFIFAETLPKELFRRHADVWTPRLSRVLSISRIILTVTLLLPLVRLFTLVLERLTRLEEDEGLHPRRHLSELIREGVGSGYLSEVQTTLADRALMLRDRTVAEVMTPWRFVTSIGAETDAAARIQLLRARRFSRLPVVDGTGKVVGVLHWLDALLQPDAPTHRLAAPVPTVPADRTVLDAISRIRATGQTIAIVRATADGPPLGIVTLKALVEQLTGELRAW
ncbi:MAG: DUF21 domain-containing protein [Phycisphaeraceae bacterium]|nr:DUF21 domain-containing protein [Phycisphaeraceae bacterium]